MTKIRFCCEAPQAEKVYLAGDFNGWEAECTRMRRSRNGEHTFVARLDLEPGVYQFKYLVDGQWLCDPTCPTVASDLGTENSVMEVSQ
jgi:1,4-alpha-glucan branching enzyme